MLELKCQENARAIAQQMSNGGSGSDVTVTQVVESGTKIATISVDDVGTDIYAPEVSVTQHLASGTKIATIAVGDVSTDVYCETVPTPETPVSVTGDGVKTARTLLDELYAQIDASKLTEKSVFVMDSGTSKNYYACTGISTLFRFTGMVMSSTTFYASQFDLRSTNSDWLSCTGSTVSDSSSTVVASGTVLSIVY